jgi:serine protease Do
MIFATAIVAASQSVMLVETTKTVGAKTGTGFVISSTATTSEILTADHVVSGGLASFVYPIGPNGPRYPATIVTADVLRDAAVLQIPLGKLPVLQLSDSFTPISGTKVEVFGYPTLRNPSPSPSSSPDADENEPQSLPMTALQLTMADGTIDGETELGESILFDVSVTHGDSGAPVIDLGSGRVVAMVLGLANGYGSAEWMSGDGLGLSVDGLQSVLNPFLPASPMPKPAYSIAMSPLADATISSSWAQLGPSAGFVPSIAAKTAACVDPSNVPVANAVVDQEGDGDDLWISVTDCSGALVYQDELTGGGGDEPNLIRLIDRAFLGFIDSHRSEWSTLLHYGVMADPAANPYLALMSVERNPFGQMIVGHTFHGGPADLAGIMPGDAILKIDGRPTRSLADRFIARLMNQPTVTFLMDRQLHQFEVKLSLERLSRLTAAGPVPR